MCVWERFGKEIRYETQSSSGDSGGFNWVLHLISFSILLISYLYIYICELFLLFCLKKGSAYVCVSLQMWHVSNICCLQYWSNSFVENDDEDDDDDDLEYVYEADSTQESKTPGSSVAPGNQSMSHVIKANEKKNIHQNKTKQKNSTLSVNLKK